jgi:hypothetical protein
MAAFQPVGSHDIPVHGRRFHVAGIENGRTDAREVLCRWAYRAPIFENFDTISLALRETKTIGTGVVALHFMAGAAVT